MASSFNYMMTKATELWSYYVSGLGSGLEGEEEGNNGDGDRGSRMRYFGNFGQNSQGPPYFLRGGGWPPHAPGPMTMRRWKELCIREDWNKRPHPSCDEFGSVTGYEYYTRLYKLGLRHPSFEYIYLRNRPSSGINIYFYFTYLLMKENNVPHQLSHQSSFHFN